MPDGGTYAELLDDLAKKWISLEMKHEVSKSASNDFWSLSKKAFPKLYEARIDQMVYRDIPDFPYQRNKLQKDNVPPISIETGFLNKENEEVIVVESEKSPSKFNTPQYTKLYEVATIKVCIISKSSYLWVPYVVFFFYIYHGRI